MLPLEGGPPQFSFSWLDYLFFFGMLSLSALIGIYFGCCVTKQNSAKEYLLAGRTMNIVPVAMSLISSNISGITIMGAPSDIYKYGANYIWSLISMVITSVACVYVYMPVFLNLELVSTYQYLEMRFDKKIRTLASILFTLQVLLINPILIYIPALAFSQATGLHLHLIAPTLCIVCIFYTTIGGLKAVLWTDTLQTTSIFICLLVVFGMGLSASGGVANVIEIADKGERLDIFDFRLDPTKRDSFWGFVFGCTISWMVDISVNQSTIQRVMAVPTRKQAEKVIYIFCIGTMLIKAFTTFIGVMMYAKYSDCDPIGSGKVTHIDQMVPYYVIDVGGRIPGLPGLFIAGIFSGGLSSLSTTLNTLAATFYSDFISRCMPDTITEKRKSKILKLIVVVGGIICILLVFVVEKMGGILQLAVTFGGITSGSLLGLFTLGMVFPIANATGALCGGVAGLVFNSWLVLSNQWYKYRGLIKDFPKPLSVEGCGFGIHANVTQPYVIIGSTEILPIDLRINEVVGEEPNAVFRISFWYYTFLGFVVVLAVGLIVSCLTKKTNQTVRRELLSPAIHFLLPKEKSCEVNLDTTKL